MTTTLEICNEQPSSPKSWETATAKLYHWNGFIFAVVRWCAGQWGIYEHSTGLLLASSANEGVRSRKALVKNAVEKMKLFTLESLRLSIASKPWRNFLLLDVTALPHLEEMAK